MLDRREIKVGDKVRLIWNPKPYFSDNSDARVEEIYQMVHTLLISETAFMACMMRRMWNSWIHLISPLSSGASERTQESGSMEIY